MKSLMIRRSDRSPEVNIISLIQDVSEGLLRQPVGGLAMTLQLSEGSG